MGREFYLQLRMSLLLPRLVMSLIRQTTPIRLYRTYKRGDITGTDIGIATDDNVSFRITTEIRFNKIRYILKMTRATEKNVASIDSVVLDTTIAPKRRRLFECDILVGGRFTTKRRRGLPAWGEGVGVILIQTQQIVLLL